MTDQHREKSFGETNLTRREFVTGVTAMGVTAAVSPLFSPSRAAAASPKQGGRLRVAVYDFSTADTLDPTSGSGSGLWGLGFQLKNGLVEEGPGGVLVPELAESWDASSDMKRWTFKLRKGVEFHNGKPFEAEDVIYSINLHRGPDSKSAAKVYTEPIESIEADNRHVLVVTLKSGNVDFPATLTVPYLTIVPAGTRDFDRGIGTGPYILQAYEPGVRALTRRNPNYWKEDRAHFDEVETIGIADVTARTNALMTGEIDAMASCDLKTVDRLEAYAGIRVLRVTGKAHFVFPMITTVEPFSANHVRLALKHAIDREHIVKNILFGNGTVGNDHPISRSYPFFAAEVPQRTYDPDKAAFHLKKAGVAGRTFKLHAADAPFLGAVDTAVLYRQHAAKAGIDMDVVREPNDGYWSNVWMKKAWCASMWSGRTTEDLMLSEAYQGGAPWNETFWRNERFDRLLVTARTERDKAKRAEMYAEMQRLIRDEGGAVIPAFKDFVDAVRSNVRTGELSSSFELDGRRYAERWWFES